MRAGQLRERITLQINTPTRDTFGAEVPHWADLATVWAKVEARSGNEVITQSVGVVTTIYQITIRKRTDVTAALQIIYEGLTLQISAVLESDDTASLVLLCQTVQR